MFVVAVLAVIGIGVGVLAATTNQRVYGPSWGRFTVALPGRLYQSREAQPAGRSSSAQIVQYLRTPFGLPAFIYSNSPSPWFDVASAGVWVGTGEVDAVTVQEAIRGNLGNTAIEQDVGVLKKYFFVAGATESINHANGFSVMTIGPQCSNVHCEVARLVSNGRVLWELFAFSPAPASTVELFLASFEPIG